VQEPIVINSSAFRVAVLPILDRDGAPARVVLVKASFSIGLDGVLELLPEQREVRLGDELWGPPQVSDVRLPGDYCASKPGTDFVVAGHATPPAGQSPNSVEVGISVSHCVKRLRVHGPRLWRHSMGRVVPALAARMREPVPLAWSRAWGGIDLSDPRMPLEEALNPVGSGVARYPEALVNTPAPQIEAATEPIGAAGGTQRPAGCAAIGPGYQPRRAHGGTYDEVWLKSGYPARPPDYRDEHQNVAPTDQRFAEPLRGGEPVVLEGVHATRVLRMRLPKWRVVVEATINGDRIERRPHLDTVLVDSDALALELVWRSLFRCPPKMYRRFEVVRVQAKEFVE
jgi:hypothetical protein